MTVPPLLRLMTEANVAVRHAAQGALYYLLSFDKGSDKAERAINAFGSKLGKKDGSAVSAMIVTARKSLVRLNESELRVKDELRRQGAGAEAEEDGDGVEHGLVDDS